MNDFDEYLVAQMIDAFDASPVNVSVDRDRLHAIIKMIRQTERHHCVQAVESIQNNPNLPRGQEVLLAAVIKILERA